MRCCPTAAEYSAVRRASSGGLSRLTSQSFPAALTLAGNNVVYDGPGTNSFFIRGQDQCGAGPAMLPAIGYTNGSASDNSKSQYFRRSHSGGELSWLVNSKQPPAATACSYG